MFNNIKQKIEKLRKGKGELAKSTEFTDRAESKKKGDSINIDGTAWSVYDNGAFDENIQTTDPNGRKLRGRTDGFFSENGLDTFTALSTFEQAKNNFDTLKNPNKKSICLDIMGQGRIGHDLKADISMGWTYKEASIESLPGRELKYGDLFDKKVLDSHIQDLKKQISEEGDLNAVFWRAVGGLGIYYDNEYALSYLYENLFREVYKLANTDCKFYLSMRYGSSRDGTDHMDKLMEKLKESGFDVIVKKFQDRGGNYILTKTENKNELPSLRVLIKDFKTSI